MTDILTHSSNDDLPGNKCSFETSVGFKEAAVPHSPPHYVLQALLSIPLNGRHNAWRCTSARHGDLAVIFSDIQSGTSLVPSICCHQFSAPPSLMMPRQAPITYDQSNHSSSRPPKHQTSNLVSASWLEQHTISKLCLAKTTQTDA